MGDEGWVHLGDGVYAKKDLDGVMLHANSHNEPTDKIYLEWTVYNRLIDFSNLKGSDET